MGYFAIFLFLKQSLPCTNTHSDTAVPGKELPRSRRPSHILTVAEQKQAYKHGCSHQHFHLSGLQLCPSNKASLLSQSQEANQEWLFFLCSLCHQESKTATGGASFLFLRKKKKKIVLATEVCAEVKSYWTVKRKFKNCFYSISYFLLHMPFPLFFFWIPLN